MNTYSWSASFRPSSSPIKPGVRQDIPQAADQEALHPAVQIGYKVRLAFM